ncbi:MAG: DUF4129 domain-containing protein, partial [Methyloprofundus sp.]|nr:DUF4129 domain-containing protein [Methyloprofundus sp.]
AIAPGRVEQDVNIEQQIANNAVSFAPVKLDSQTLSYLKMARNLWSSVDYRWHRWIINYDRKHQLSFLSGWGIDSLKAMLYWLFIWLATVTVLLAIYVFRKQASNMDKAQIYYAKACKKLSKKGLIRQGNEGANDFAERVSVKVPQLKESFTQITQLYVQIRYGKGTEKLQLEQLKVRAVAFRVSNH